MTCSIRRSIGQCCQPIHNADTKRRLGTPVVSFIFVLFFMPRYDMTRYCPSSRFAYRHLSNRLYSSNHGSGVVEIS